MPISIKRDADTFEIPDKLPCLPLRDVVIYPFVVMPLLGPTTGSSFSSPNATASSRIPERAISIASASSAASFS
jgi:hypothetical protein